MFNRRTFLSLAASGITASRLASAQQASGKVTLYANVGPDLTHYDLDVVNAAAGCGGPDRTEVERVEGRLSVRRCWDEDGEQSTTREYAHGARV